MKWLIQDSRGKHYNWIALSKAALDAQDDVEFCSIIDIEKLKVSNKEKFVLIGGDDYLEAAYKRESLRIGIQYDELFFNVNSYLRMWKECYINYDCSSNGIHEIGYFPPGEFFIRPMCDKKCFDGRASRIPQDIEMIKNQIANSKCNSIEKQKKCICISKIKKIEREWRAVIINESVVSICQYAAYGNTAIDSDNIPKDIVFFINEMIQMTSNCPKAWVLDVGLVNKEYKVIEANIFNASNFYDCNRAEIIKAYDEYFECIDPISY